VHMENDAGEDETGVNFANPAKAVKALANLPEDFSGEVERITVPTAIWISISRSRKSAMGIPRMIARAGSKAQEVSEMMRGNDVNRAFEILLEEIELVANNLNEEGAAAFKAGNYDAARHAIEEATRLADFRDKVKALQKEWASLVVKRPQREAKARLLGKSRLPRGLRTPEEAFRRPVLEALVELGGKAPIGNVLDLVGEKMKAILTKYDLEPLPSDRKRIRWRNTAQWCRNTLVREGLMKSDSPYGIWEISGSGRKALQNESPLS